MIQRVFALNKKQLMKINFYSIRADRVFKRKKLTWIDLDRLIMTRRMAEKNRSKRPIVLLLGFQQPRLHTRIFHVDLKFNYRALSAINE